MARQAHFIQLTKGVQSWNQWRNNYPTIKPNLNNLNLRGWNLAGINLKDTDLRGTNLKGANLQQAYLNWANLQNASLEEADLKNADLRQALVEEAILIAANLREACLIGANFAKADLSHADLTRTFASKTNFEYATLTGVCLQDWSIDKFTNLSHVICEYVYFRQNHQERRPKHYQQNFDVEEFSNLFKNALDFQNQSINQLFDFSAKLPPLQFQMQN